MTEPPDDSARPSDPADRMTESGWIIESTESGGVRVRAGATLRRCILGCSFGHLLPLGLFAAVMYFVGGKLWEDPPEQGVLLVFLALISLGIVGTIGMMLVGIVLQILWLLLVRAEWEVGTNRLEIRRRLLGFSWGSEHRDGALLLEANYDKGKPQPFWQLAVKSDGRKRYLIREGALSDFGTAIGFKPSREVVETAAEFLAQHTGWSVISAEREAAEAVRATADRRELPAELRAAGFRADVDERLRLRIRRPALGQIGCGLIPLVAGGICLAVVVHIVQDVIADHELTLDGTLWLTPWLMVGVTFVFFGFVIVFSRERWVVDRDLFIVRSRLFGWKSEKQYVDGAFNLTRVSRKTEDGRVWSWELQLQNQAGGVLNALYRDDDDDLPRLLGAVLSQCTGWPMHEVEDSAT